MQDFTVDNFIFLSPKSERERINFSLSTIKKALTKLNNPCQCIPAVQIIGTNGKGSITAFLENILFCSNIKVGVTTSPHFFDISERIRVNKTKIETAEFEQLLQKVQNQLTGYQLSPFELIICCALKFFDQKKVTLLLLEAGLGGRLDATTAHNLRPLIALGKIGLDHTEYLGSSIESITKEKVAVIKKDSYVISFHQEKAVENIINKRVRNVGAKILWVEKPPKKWELGLKGEFQKENAAVAAGVIKILNTYGYQITSQEVKKGLASTKWSGRLEIIQWKNKEILVDSAHNPLAAEVLAKERQYWSNQDTGIYWIIGIQKQKDLTTFIKNLISPIDKVLLVPVPFQESWDLKNLLKTSNFESKELIEFKSFKNAVDYLERLKNWPKCHPVVTGSIYLVSEFIKYAKANQ